jgi:hypothetical protein
MVEPRLAEHINQCNAHRVALDACTEKHHHHGRGAMSKVRKVISAGVIAAGMTMTLAPTAVLAAPAGQAPAVRVAACPQSHAATLPRPEMFALLLGSGGGGGGNGNGNGNGNGGGTSTTGLPSSALIAIGLLPPLVLGAMWRRRRRSK